MESMTERGSVYRLMEQLDGAKLVRYDADGFMLAWFGDDGVHSYDEDGTEVGFWKVEDANSEKVERSMTAYILNEEEPYAD